MVHHPVRHQMHDAALPADLAEHAHQPSAEQDAALQLEELGADDDVGESGFVFQGDESYFFPKKYK